jgi:hypothetical protein
MNVPSSSRRRCIRLLGLALCLFIVGNAAPAFADQNYIKGFWGPTKLDGQSAFPIYQDLGVDLYQIQLRWERTALTKPKNPKDPTDPAYKWPANLDYAVQQASQHGMKVGILVMGAPKWANGGQVFSRAPLNDGDYAAFVTAAAKHYSTVRTWMIWGETNRTANFNVAGPATFPQLARRYARLLDRAYGALKAVSSKNIVVGGMTFSEAAGQWAANMRLKNGKPPRMDLFGHNPFSTRRPVINSRPSPKDFIAIADLRRFRKIVDRLKRPGKRAPRIFLSEYTLPTAEPDRSFAFHVSEATQAKWIGDAFRTVRREPGIYGLGWFFLRDETPATPGAPAAHGGLLDATGRQKPGYAAFQQA